MNLLNLAFLAPIAMAWGQIKQFFTRLSSVLIVRSDLQGAIADNLHDILWKEWKPLPLGSRLYMTSWFGFKAFQGHAAPVVLELYSGAVVFRQGLRFVVWAPKDCRSARLTCLRFNVKVQPLIEQAALVLYANQEEGVKKVRSGGLGFYVHHFQGENVSAKRRDSSSKSSEPAGVAPPSEGPAANYVDLGVVPAFDRYPLICRSADQFGSSEDIPPLVRHYLDPQLNELTQEIEAWADRQDWMRKRGIAHRRGILLEGPPGTGKSSLVEALAQHFNTRLVVVDLATCSDFDLPTLRAWARSPSFFLFEDIDRIFEGNKNITDREVDKLSFDAFINLISGVEPLEGMIFFTSNHPEKLDESLLRPGRVDRRIKVPLLSAEGRQCLAERILEGCGQEWMDRALIGATDQPAANFENTCIQLALEWCWQTNRNETTTVPCQKSPL